MYNPSFHQLARTMKNRAWVILLVMISICGLSAFYTFYIVNPVYEASTRIIVNNNSVNETKSLDYSQLNANIQLIETYKQIIKSATVMDGVIKANPDLNLTLEQLLSNVNVSSVNDTQVMIISAQDASYDKAVAIANAVSQQFQNQIPSIMKIDNVLTLDKAEASLGKQQISPDPILSMLLSFVLSLLISAGVVYMLESFDDSFKSEEDIEQLLGIPLLGTIPTITKRHLMSKSRAAKGRVADSQYAG